MVVEQLLGAPSLTLRSSPGVGLHVHLAKAKRDKCRIDKDPAFIAVQASNTTACYFYAVGGTYTLRFMFSYLGRNGRVSVHIFLTRLCPCLPRRRKHLNY